MFPRMPVHLDILGMYRFGHLLHDAGYQHNFGIQNAFAALCEYHWQYHGCGLTDGTLESVVQNTSYTNDHLVLKPMA